MGGGDTSEYPSEKDTVVVVVGEGPFAGVRLIDAPILLLVCFHKAFRAELAELHQLTSSYLEIGSPGRDIILDLLRRFRFLKVAYKYHTAAEDEVIFQALDQRIRNVTYSYSLEHRTIDNLFESVFQCFNAFLEDDGKFSQPFQELVFCTYTIQSFICQHMLKEEEQVFSLLIQLFSFEEQAALVWQFICSVPIMLLEDFFPWMTSYLPANEQADVVLCIKEVVPKENLLQEVVTSWIGKKSQPAFKVFNTRESENLFLSSDEPLYLKDLPKIYSSWKSLSGKNCCSGELDCIENNSKRHPVDGLRLWHAAISKDLKEILEELHEIRRSRTFSTLASVGGQLKFFADVLIFYSDALEKVFFSVLNELANGGLSLSYQRFPDDNQIEGLFRALQNISSQNGSSLSSHVEKLSLQLVSFLEGISNHFAFQESEVFPLIRKNCDYEMQQRLLYTSLQVMPLGLLKCVITWLSTHLTENESKAILCGIKRAGSVADMSFALLLHEWVRIGYSGKTSLEKFREELQEMFKNRGAFLPDQIEVNTGFSLDLDGQHCKKSNPGQVKSEFSDKAKNSVPGTHPFKVEKKYSTLYSSEINLQIFFPEALKKLSPFPEVLVQNSDAGSSFNPEFKPIDFIFLFHKALKNDLEYLILVSAKMAKNVGFLKEFLQRFHLVQFLYQFHSDSEDKIAFPALEAMGKLQNISHSYSIDHKLEKELFSNISTILYEISELHVALPAETSSVLDGRLDQRFLNYRQLCMKLHGMCKTMCTALGKHVYHEEIELWPLFTECFSYEEQEKIIGCMLGRTRAEILQVMLPWLMASLTPGEQHGMMLMWRKATKNTMFNEWLAEWWEGMAEHGITAAKEESNVLPSGTADSLEMVATYLSRESYNEPEGMTLHYKELMFLERDSVGAKIQPSRKGNGDSKTKTLNGIIKNFQYPECTKANNEDEKNRCQKSIADKDQVEKPFEVSPVDQKLGHDAEHLLTMSDKDLEAAIRRISRDTTLDSQKKSRIFQDLLTSRWTVSQQKPHQQVAFLSDDGEIPGQCPSYRDEAKQTFGCKHYKRNYRYCHDDAVADHLMDRKSTTEMMCMKCLKVQPIGPTCSNISCNNLSMARYFCKICKLYDDERWEIYHCPYCNLCRLGKGLGIDYFHCMNCNACMSNSLTVHICREKCFESNCPICHEDIFTSSSPVKALACGHLMHSTCFQDYTCTHYTCPICSKSLGDMQVYFGMLDALLAAEKVPQEYSGRTQDILCNDCEKKGIAPFHWFHHKCPHCGSYNTRLL
ncbi:zinc finger protein [Macleaya cordata]|uniref:Zinc finger protein n=1 Tax=Macleaya cordata TaxID=56857 RepID=A0A200QF78_MACCD|nr:zinc finger protein [Macleaya cordata]